MGGSIFDERDPLKIYIINPHPGFLKPFYSHVLSLKKNFAGFDINKNRDRTARGFDLGGLPGAVKKLSFGQILGYRTAFHLLNNLHLIKNLSDDEAGKKEFVRKLKEQIERSQTELIKAMDKYIKCGVISDIKKMLKESGINIR